MQRSSPTPHRHVVVYDGVCGMCNAFVRFTLARDPDGRFAFAALDDPWASERLERDGRLADRLYVIADAGTSDERVLQRSDAALFVVARVRGPWRIARVLRFVPRAIRDTVYRLVARLRYALSGRLDACPAPPPEHRARFLDRVS